MQGLSIVANMDIIIIQHYYWLTSKHFTFNEIRKGTQLLQPVLLLLLLFLSSCSLNSNTHRIFLMWVWAESEFGLLGRDESARYSKHHHI